jgi:hypothetical protein
MTITIILIALLVGAIGALVVVHRNVRRLEADRDTLEARQAAAESERDRLRTRYAAVEDVEVERQQVLSRLATERQQVLSAMAAERQQVLSVLAAERAANEADLDRIRQEQARGAAQVLEITSRIEELRAEFAALDEQSNLQSFGFYKPVYDFASSSQYEARLEHIRGEQKRLIKEKRAAVCDAEWTVNGSKAEGRKQTNQTLKLMLRAFNGECDAAITKVKYNNVHVMATRIRKACDAINALVSVQQATITRTYLQLKLDELHLVHEYQEKLQEEKEEQRRIREQMREEEIALREMERVRQDAEKEETRYATALEKARREVEQTSGDKQARLLAQIEDLTRKLTEAHELKERALARAQMTRSGHVYVISNVGSFGEQVYKIGMTRRLDPMERVRELGDASVPFQFDVHAIIYTEDAPGLENALHKRFHHRRLNRVNERKEFFHVSLDDISQVVAEHHGTIEFTMAAEAEEYRKTLAFLKDFHPEDGVALGDLCPVHWLSQINPAAAPREVEVLSL